MGSEIVDATLLIDSSLQFRPIEEHQVTMEVDACAQSDEVGRTTMISLTSSSVSEPRYMHVWNPA